MTKVITEEDVRSALLELGVESHRKGYKYLVRCVFIYINEQDSYTGFTDIYSIVAKEVNAMSLGSIERAIRCAIRSCVPRIKREAWVLVFGRGKEVTLNGKDSIKNSVFISSISEYICLEKGRRV